VYFNNTEGTNYCISIASVSGNDRQCDVVRTLPILFYAWFGLRPCLVEPRLKLGPLPIPCMIDELVWSVGGVITTGQGVSTPRKTFLSVISSTTNHTRDIEPGDYLPGLWHRLIIPITLCSYTRSCCCRACYSYIGIMGSLLSCGEGSEVIVQECQTKINSVTVWLCIFEALFVLALEMLEFLLLCQVVFRDLLYVWYPNISIASLRDRTSGLKLQCF